MAVTITHVCCVEPVTEEYVLGWTRLIITFEIQPFLFLDSPTIALTSGQTVWNPGLVSDPYFKNHRNRICNGHYQRRIIHGEPNRPVH